MSFNSYSHAVSLSQYTNMTAVHKFGRNGDVANATWEPVTSVGALNWLTAAAAVRIKAGGNAADAAAGAGAREVTVVGLDENWQEVTETIATNGASASSPTSTTFIRLYRAWVSEVGSYGGAAAAAIDIETTGGTLMLDIPAADNQSQAAIYTVPAGRGLYLTHVDVNVPTGKSADFRFFRRSDANNTADTFRAPRVFWYRDGVDTQADEEFGAPIYFPPYTDLWIEAYGDGANVSVEAEFDFVLVDL